MKCTCEYCSGADYDSSDFFIDLTANLSKERPIGVSGLLRVKNDEDFLSACIDSCIGPLDELIIVCQPSDDRTQQIVETKRRQYPDKIRAYFYRPRFYPTIFPSRNSNMPRNYRPTQSICSPTITTTRSRRASYRYAVKIDSLIKYIFPQKLQRFADAYQEPNKKNTAGSPTRPSATRYKHTTGSRHVFPSYSLPRSGHTTFQKKSCGPTNDTYSVCCPMKSRC